MNHYGVTARRHWERWRAATARVVEPSSQRASHRAALGFIWGMARALNLWREEHVPDEARAVASYEAEQQLIRWRAANGPSPA
jgi:hypothetical protein